MIKGMIFDFWGTLVENGVYSPTKQLQEILRSPLPYGEFIVKLEEVFMTKQFPDQETAFIAVCKAFDVNPHHIMLDKLIGLWNNNKFTAKPYDDTIAYLKSLKERGIKTALVSNTDNFSVSFVLDKYKLMELFDVIAMSYDVGALKTNPKLYEHALTQLGLQKEEVLIVGDSLESDMAGAQKVGITGVLMDRRDRREYSPKVTALQELDQFLEGD